MKKKLYLTKSRKKRLEMELSIDEILYRKFEQMQQGIDEYARHLKKTYKNVIQVEKRKDGINYILRIVDVQSIPGEGLIIIVD